MKSDATKFIECLNNAEAILESYQSKNLSEVDFNPKHTASVHFDLALFEQWSEFFEPEVQKKPPIRIVQHLSCTGGTLISKCIAAMPNVALLSEPNPMSPLREVAKPQFAPTDLTYLAIQGNFPLIEALRGKIFQADIDVISDHIKQLGKYLVIREHSHSDYLIGESANESSTIKELLRDSFSVMSVITIRHPIDSFLSLRHNNWVHFTPGTFEEYCNRYLVFIEQNKDVTTYKYEDLVADPCTELKRICEALKLPFNEDFQDIFDLNALSGDSGRSSAFISKKQRRNYDDRFRKEVNGSNSYLQLCELLNYQPSIE